MCRPILIFFLLLPALPELRAQQVFQSSLSRAAVMELYTSEGCSSCPPAEEIFARLRDDPRLWKEVVPVAFHVTYFDSTAWKDRFASPAFTTRQRAYAQAWASDRIYTPCFVLNGTEGAAQAGMASAENPGILTVDHSRGGQVRVSFRPAKTPPDKYDVYAALLGGGVTSEVRGGENAGRQLAHEFIALTLQKADLIPAPDGTFDAILSIDEAHPAPTPRHALAVWITRRGQLSPLQATGGWLD